MQGNLFLSIQNKIYFKWNGTCIGRIVLLHRILVKQITPLYSSYLRYINKYSHTQKNAKTKNKAKRNCMDVHTEYVRLVLSKSAGLYEVDACFDLNSMIRGIRNAVRHEMFKKRKKEKTNTRHCMGAVLRASVWMQTVYVSPFSALIS